MRRTRMAELVDDALSGKIGRRKFLQGAMALGVSSTAAATLLADVAAQESTPEASPAASPIAYTGPVGTLSPDREAFMAAITEKFQFTDPATTGGSLIYTETSDISTLNTIISSDVYSALIIGFLFDGLVATSPVDGSFGPGIADSWEIAADGCTYTFHLNAEAAWHDGTPITADDILFTLDRVLDPASLSPRTGDVASVVKSYEKVDDHTLNVVSFTPVAPFIDKTFNQFAILPKHIWESVKPADMASDPGSTGSDVKRIVGSGPFTFKEWVQNDHITLVKNPNYWDKAHNPGYLDEFVYRVIVDPASAVQSLKTGETDIFALEPSQAKGLDTSNPEITQSIYDTFSFTFYAANQDPAHTDLFLDTKVRQALMYGLDRDLIVESVLLGFGTRADGTQPVPSPAYAPDKMNTIYGFDPDKAKALIAEAGWADSDGDGIVEKDGKKFSFECLYSEGITTYTQLLPYAQQAWKEIGLEMIPTAVPFPTLLDGILSFKYEMAFVGFSWGVDPDQSVMFGSNNLVPNGFNLTGWKNARYDEITPLATQELDVAKRLDMIIEQSNIVNDDAAMGIITFGRNIIANGPRVHNYYANAYGGFLTVPWVWLDK
ncbi:MAG: ABC transporter substrate-binding protein [Thermomicrobiales bacterium]